MSEDKQIQPSSEDKQIQPSLETPHLMIPINEEEYKKLYGEEYQPVDSDIPEDEPYYIGAWVSAWDLKRGIDRWKKMGSPDPLDHHTRLLIIQLLQRIVISYSDDIDKSGEKLKELTEDNERLDRLQKESDKLFKQESTAREATKKEYTATLESKRLLETQVKAKEKRINELEDTVNTQSDRIVELRLQIEKPLNIVQRSVRNLFRLP